MMVFYCPLAFRHKKGECILELSSCRVLSLGGEYFFGWSLWSLDYIYVPHIVFYLFSSCYVFDGIFMLGGFFFFLVGTLYVSYFKLFIDLYL